MFLVVRTPRKTIGPASHNVERHKKNTEEGHEKNTEEAGFASLMMLAVGASAVSGIRLSLQWILETQ